MEFFWTFHVFGSYSCWDQMGHTASADTPTRQYKHVLFSVMAVSSSIFHRLKLHNKWWLTSWPHHKLSSQPDASCGQLWPLYQGFACPDMWCNFNKENLGEVVKATSPNDCTILRIPLKLQLYNCCKTVLS